MSWACEVIYKGRLWPFFGDQRKKMVKAEFERLSLSELPWLYTCAVYLTKDSEMAEDLVQDTYLEAYRRFNSYEAGANCRVWLLSILRKIFIHRKGKRVVEPEIINWNKLHQDYESLVPPPKACRSLSSTIGRWRVLSRSCLRRTVWPSYSWTSGG